MSGLQAFEEGEGGYRHLYLLRLSSEFWELPAGWVDHRRPYPGDQGIRFEPKDGYQVDEDLEQYLSEYSKGMLRGFQQLWFHHTAVVHEYEAGRLTREEMLDQMSEWLLEDRGEHYWTVVWATRQWFRLYGDVWVETEPLFTMQEIERDGVAPDTIYDDIGPLFYPASLEVFEYRDPFPQWMRDLNEAHAAEAGRVNRLIKDLLATRLSNAEDA
ncbi:MAG: hypothetical protein IPK19_27150 [Chloroflexi bacterium]|nr:hypothetical protein [Chloroflexota bacterium]